MENVFKPILFKGEECSGNNGALNRVLRFTLGGMNANRAKVAVDGISLIEGKDYRPIFSITHLEIFLSIPIYNKSMITVQLYEVKKNNKGTLRWATEQVKKGKRIRQKSWENKKMFLFVDGRWGLTYKVEGESKGPRALLSFEYIEATDWEIIKWVKEFNDLDSEGNIKNKELRKFHSNEEECWIEYFFNITEEDMR